MLFLLLTVGYFGVFAFLTDLVFRHTLSMATDLLAVACLFLALFASVALGDWTAKKIRRLRSKK